MSIKPEVARIARRGVDHFETLHLLTTSSTTSEHVFIEAAAVFHQDLCYAADVLFSWTSRRKAVQLGVMSGLPAAILELLLGWTCTLHLAMTLDMARHGYCGEIG